MPDIKNIEKEARKIIRKNKLKYLPYDLNMVLRKYGISVVYDSFDKFGAMLCKNENLMIVNSSRDFVQQRFHIAHELGHYVLDHQGNLFKSLFNVYIIDNKKSPIEQEADIFASELLIPSTKVKRLGLKNNFDVPKLKQIFAVSEMAMAYKLHRLGLPYKNTRYNFNKKFYL